MARKLSAKNAEYLHSLARNGDMVANALLQMATEVRVTVGTLAAGTIPVSGQVVDGLGIPVQGVTDIQLDINTASDATMAVTTGTSKLSATAQLWLQTNSLGAFAVNVSNPTGGELSLLRIMSPDGIHPIVELQF